MFAEEGPVNGGKPGLSSMASWADIVKENAPHHDDFALPGLKSAAELLTEKMIKVSASFCVNFVTFCELLKLLSFSGVIKSAALLFLLT